MPASFDVNGYLYPYQPIKMDCMRLKTTLLSMMRESGYLMS